MKMNLSGPEAQQKATSEHHPFEDAFTEEEMFLAGIYARALTGGPTDLDREAQEHLDRIEKKREASRNGRRSAKS